MDEQPAGADDSAWALPPVCDGGGTPDLGRSLQVRGAGLTRDDFLELLKIDQEEKWQGGRPLLVEDYLKEYPSLAADAEAVLDLVYHEYVCRQRAGDSPRVEEYLERLDGLPEPLGAK